MSVTLKPNKTLITECRLQELNAQPINWAILTGIIVLVCIAMPLLMKRKNKRNSTSANHFKDVPGIGSGKELIHPALSPGIVNLEETLSATELRAYALILNNSRLNKITSIDALNQITGVGKKNSGTQKKQRSDIIQSINAKYRNITANSGKIVLSRRCESDKRSFEYFIEMMNPMILANGL